MYAVAFVEFLVSVAFIIIMLLMLYSISVTVKHFFQHCYAVAVGVKE